ncbi:hypothetical protein [Paludisphaera mucosa]|uniref:Uncharacterized protein n=1 Tax=Paludisphaera mucosa TaxID=3030827 RepID=A0ABT6FCZ7_9BACT|nr:hypothetical protein [Paludisphaera mucosa]MDG3005263.1 hypothetical protein [Paludisphaera mucosa]
MAATQSNSTTKPKPETEPAKKETIITPPKPIPTPIGRPPTGS